MARQGTFEREKVDFAIGYSKLRFPTLKYVADLRVRQGRNASTSVFEALENAAFQWVFQYGPCFSRLWWPSVVDRAPRTLEKEGWL